MPQFRLPDYAGAVQRGREFAQRNTMADMGVQAQRNAMNRDQAIQGTLGRMGQTPTRNTLAELARQGPQGVETATQLQQMFGNMSAEEQAEKLRRAREISSMLAGVNDQASYDVVRQMATEENPEIAARIPEQYDPNVVSAFYNRFREVENVLGGGSSAPAGLREFQGLTEAAGFKPGSEQYQNAARIRLRTEAPAATGGSQTFRMRGADGRERVFVFDPRTRELQTYSDGQWITAGSQDQQLFNQQMARPDGGPQQPAGGQSPQQQPPGRGRQPGPDPFVGQTPAQSNMESEFGERSTEEFFKSRDTAKSAASSLSGIREARRLLADGVITGAGANFKVSMGKALQTIGFNVAQDEIANSEAFLAAQAQQVANIIKQFGAGTGLSDKDREFAEKAAGGQINMTKESLNRILDINERASKNVIKSYNERARQIPPDLSPYPLAIDIPGDSGGSQEDQQALEWARQNPNDPRAQQIMEVLGQ